MTRRLALLPATAILAVSVVRVARAAEDSPTVQVTADRPRPALNEVVRLTYTFSGSGVGNALRAPVHLGLKNVVVVGGPNTGTKIEFMNGVVSRTASVTYFLKPQAQGPAEVGETQWQLGEKFVKAPGYQLEVGPARAGGNQSPDDEPDDPFLFPRMSSPRAPAATSAAGRSAVLEYSVTPDKTTAYVGEEIVLTYEILTQVDITGLEYLDPPKFPGVWAEDLEKPEKPQGRRDVQNGQTVLRFTLLKKAVSGLTAGTVTLPPAKIRLAVRLGDPWDPFGMVQPKVVDRATRPITLTILPIPGRPDFTGPVGKFDLSSRVDRTTVATGDAITLKVRISGSGSLRTATQAPKVEIPGARVYDPTAKTDAGKPGGARGAVFTEWTYVVVPSVPGELKVPAVSFDVFDVAQKKIVTKATAPIAVRVEGSAAAGTVASVPPASPSVSSGSATSAAAPANPVTSSPGATQASIELPQPKVLSEPAGPGARGSGTSVDLSRGTVTLPIWLLVAAPVALVLAGGTAWAFSRKRSLPHAAAESLKPEADETKERAATRIERAIRDRLHAKFGIPDSATPSAVAEALEASGVSESQREEIAALLAETEFLRFAPQLGDYGSKIRDVREKARKLLSRL